MPWLASCWTDPAAWTSHYKTSGSLRRKHTHGLGVARQSARPDGISKRWATRQDLFDAGIAT
jgi:hypothetical protein